MRHTRTCTRSVATAAYVSLARTYVFTFGRIRAAPSSPTERQLLLKTSAGTGSERGKESIYIYICANRAELRIAQFFGGVRVSVASHRPAVACYVVYVYMN